MPITKSLTRPPTHRLTRAITQAGAGGWTPALWFLASEQGIWLDPSDFTRYMGELGPELVPNSDFSAGLSGWSNTSPGTYTAVGNRLLVADNSGTGGIYRDFTVTPGATYLIQADVELTVSGAGAFKAFPGGGFVGELATATMSAGRTTPSFSVKATTASIRVYLMEQTATVGAGFYVASVSLRELTSINTATMFQDSAGTTPVTAVEQPVGLALDKRLGLVLGSEVVAMPYSGSASGAWAVSSTSVTRNGSAGGQATVSLVGGASLPTTTRYRVTFRVSGLSGDTIGVRIGGGTAYNVTANGTYTWTVAGGGGTSFTVIPWGGVAGEAIIENISVRELPGNHTYQPTTAQKPVLKESGAYSYLNLDRVDDNLATTAGGGGTTGICISAAIRAGGAGNARTIWSDRGTNTGYRLSINASNQLVLSAGNGSAHTEVVGPTVTAGTDYVVTGWHDGTNLNVQLNAGAATSAAFGTATAGTAGFTIGKDNGAATGYYGERIYEIVYRKNDASSAGERTSLITYMAAQAGITL